MGHDRLRHSLTLLLQVQVPSLRQIPHPPAPFPDLKPLPAAQVPEGPPGLWRQRRGGARPVALPPSAEDREDVSFRGEQPPRSGQKRAEDAAAAEGLLVAGGSGDQLLHGGIAAVLWEKQRGGGEGEQRGA